MPHGLLLTQCLQVDFVAPVGPGRGLPGPLHVGQREATRLLGPVPEEGPLARFARWAEAEPASSLSIVHIRDWHDPADPAQAAHLARFQPHCLRGTPGAGLVAGLERQLASGRARAVDATGLADLHETDLAAAVAEARARSTDGVLRVGVIGVWTDAKVSFLLYDLATRLGLTELAVCSAFCASVSRAQHQNALLQLQRLLDVRVMHAPGDFASWLTGSHENLETSAEPLAPGARVRLHWRRPAPPLLADPQGEPAQLVAQLFRDCSDVRLLPLGGGFSGAAVMLAESVDDAGRAQVPSVVKVARRGDTGFERQAFESIEHVLGNAAPQLVGHVDGAEVGALRYRYASMGQGGVRSFQKAFEEGDDGSVASLLELGVGEHLGRLYAAATEEPVDVWEDYEFAPRWGPGVASHLERLGTPSADGARLALPAFGEVAHPARLYDGWLAHRPRDPAPRLRQAVVHGDLNGQNLLQDSRGNAWIIDFGRVRTGHVGRDLCKLENDLLFVMTRLDVAGVEEAKALSTFLTGAPLGLEWPTALPGLSSPAFVRLLATVGRVRSLAARFCGTEPEATQAYRVGLLRFAAHTLSFDEPTLESRRWAAWHMASLITHSCPGADA